MIHNSRLRTFCILYSAFCILLAACSSGDKKLNQLPLFDLKKYFEFQISLLKQSNPKVQKLVIQNGQAESKDMQIADWSLELKPFLESDISKPALRSSYKVDTLDTSCPGCHIAYVAVDSSQSIRKVDLLSDNNNITEITIQKNTGSKLLQSTQSLIWSVGKGYVISGKQTVSLGQENSYMIKASFLK